MKKSFIKLNEGDKHLSLGNLCRVIKEMSKNKTSALQTEIFCTLFEVSEINDTTVNNYCVGCRSIGDAYKQKYINLEKRYLNDKSVFCDIIINLLSIIDGFFYTVNIDKMGFIDHNDSSKLLAKKLYNISKNDNTIDDSIKDKLRNLYHDNRIYETLVEELLFIILVKKQPIYENELKRDVLENILNDTSISSVSLEEYLSLKLREGINYDHLLKKMADNGNAYANFELGTNEYYGFFKGYPRYDEAYKYFYNAAILNHAPSNYMIGNMYIKKLIGGGTNDELQKGYEYLKKAYELGNVAACNVIGNMYYEGIYPLEKNLDAAIKCFQEAAANDYAFALNNLGKICEKNGDYEKAFEYYEKSAQLGESWACNKVGEYYRLGTIKKDMMLSYDYYCRALDSNYHTTCYYAYYNLAKYYYMNGYDTLPKDRELAIKYFKIGADNGLIECLIELFYIYLNMYYENKSNYDDVILYKELIEKHHCFNKDYKKIIEKEIDRIRDMSIKIDV